MATESSLSSWFEKRIPDDWFVEPPEVLADRDEIIVRGVLSQPPMPEGCDDAEAEINSRAAVTGFREDTREQRIRIALEAENRFERKVSWAVRCGSFDVAFTTASVPVMTRLRLRERGVLDTLIDAGLARSRSEALAWCVRLVAEHEHEWLDELRDALAKVEAVRERGPSSTQAG